MNVTRFAFVIVTVRCCLHISYARAMYDRINITILCNWNSMCQREARYMRIWSFPLNNILDSTSDASFEFETINKTTKYFSRFSQFSEKWNSRFSYCLRFGHCWSRLVAASHPVLAPSRQFVVHFLPFASSSSSEFTNAYEFISNLV